MACISALMKRKYFQPRSASGAEALLHKKRDQQDRRKDRRERLYTGAAEGVFQRQSCESGDWSGKGKKLYDKRADIAKKDIRREAEKEFKVRNLY